MNVHPRPSGATAARRGQRGVAFLVVLWVVALVAVLLGGFAVVARTENLQARHLLDGTRARYAAEAGVNLAAYGLRRTELEQRWVPDGRPYVFQFAEAEVTVRVNSESGKIDINTANEDQLLRLFQGTGRLDEEMARTMAARVIDWRDPDDLTALDGAEAPEYEQAGLPYGPSNGPFIITSELQQVLGMDYELYRRLEPAITVYSNTNTPNAMYAPLEALLAMPDMTEEEALELIALRQQIPPGADPGMSGLTLPDGTPLIASGGGVTYSIRSSARLPNGASTALDVTIRMGGRNTGARPFVIMRWQEGDRS